MNEITKKQRELIEDMNEFCTEKFKGTTKTEASDYISRNIEEFRLLIADTWSLKYM